MTLSTNAHRRLEALEVLATSEPRWSTYLPIRTNSRANDHQSHWRSTAKVSAGHRNWTHTALSSRKTFIRGLLKGGLVVRVVRIAPRALDSHDNLGTALKSVIDGVADALGVNDRDERVSFVPDAERPPTPKTWGVRIEFYEAGRDA